MKYFKVLYDTYTHSVGGYDPDDEWSRDSTEGTVTVKGIKEVDEKSYSDLFLSDGPLDKVYLLWCEYTTGDSFGRDGGQFEGVMLHRNLDAARENARRIRAHNEGEGKGHGKNAYTVTLLTDEGEEFKCDTPWNGFFETLDSVNIELVSLSYKEEF
jgi:hypothetical protein